MLPLAPMVFPLTCPPVRPRGVGAVCADADEAATLCRLETQLELQVRHPQGFPRLQGGVGYKWEAVSTSNHFQNHFQVTSAVVTMRGDKSRLLIGARGK